MSLIDTVFGIWSGLDKRGGLGSAIFLKNCGWAVGVHSQVNLQAGKNFGVNLKLETWLQR